MAMYLIQFLPTVALSEFSGVPSTKQTIIVGVVTAIVLIALAIISLLLGRSQKQWKSIPRRGFSAEDLVRLCAEGEISTAEYLKISESVGKIPSKPARPRGRRSIFRKSGVIVDLFKRSPKPCPKCGYDLPLLRTGVLSVVQSFASFNWTALEYLLFPRQTGAEILRRFSSELASN